MAQHGEATAKRTVLVVEDEDRIRELLQMAVRALGHEVEEAPNGQQALRCLARRSYDVIFCDLLMPRMTGDELFRICRQEHPEVAGRFVFVTSCLGGLPCTDFAVNTGQPLLTKPWRLGEIEAAIDQIARSVAVA
jgi:CheY-like chemotaxis protein